MRYSLVIFDLDGTLLNTLGDLHAAVNAALTRRNFPARTLEEVRAFVGNGVKNLITRALPNNSPQSLIEETLKDFKAYYNAHLSVYTHPYDGIPELLRALMRSGYFIGVNSNKYDGALQALMLEHLPGLYDLAIGEMDGVPRKPSPVAAQRILSTAGCSPSKSVYIGDSDVDIETARRAGMDAISVTWGFRSRDFLEAHHPNAIVDTPEMLLQYLSI